MSDTPAPIDSNPAHASHADDSVQVVSLYQKHRTIYARAVTGLFAKWRWALVWATQLLFYLLPWVQWNGRQAVLFDLVQRRFYVFGLVLYPQDLIYLSALLMISAYALFLFTAVAGRLWCGYACPQTVYTEIYMWIERKLEGDRVKRMKLDEAPWSLEKFSRKSAKQLAWIAVGLWTGFTFVGYFTPIRQQWFDVLAWTLGPWQTFWIFFYGFATYGNAGFMREQVCKYMCPYARFQSAMFDKDTLIITYDKARGEPRGARSKKLEHAALAAAGKGDCIDCNLCVQVCPTGIDIRNGLQYECIGCAACVDVCDGVMDKMGYPRGLVRYTTQHGLEQKLTRAQMIRRVLRPRVLVYTAILAVILGLFAWSIAVRDPFRVDVVRDRSSLARVVDEGRIENVYRLQVMNSAERPQTYRFTVGGIEGLTITERAEMVLGPAEAQWLTLHVQQPPEAAATLGPGAHPIVFEITRVPAHAGDAPVVLKEKSTFVVPR